MRALIEEPFALRIRCLVHESLPAASGHLRSVLNSGGGMWHPAAARASLGMTGLHSPDRKSAKHACGGIMAQKPLVIALEEHYLDAEVKAKFAPADAAAGRPPHLAERLGDLGALRIREMDEAGVDVQVISHGAPSVQKMDPESAVTLARRANDRLHEACRAHPDRFAAFTVCPTPDPKAAADEL